MGVLLSMASGCGGEDDRPNVLVISVDTMRRDVMEAYGARQRFPLPVTPGLDRLSEEAVVFDNCYTISPRTTQSFASFMTGLFPTNHGAFGLFHELSTDVTTLAEIFQREGYRTQAIVSNFFLQSGRGFDQGFDVYDDAPFRHDREVAEYVVDRADLASYDLGDDPYFMWVHLLDPHWRYTPPRPLVEMLNPNYDRSFTLYQDLDDGLLTQGSLIFENELDDVDRRYLRRLYLGEVVHADGHIDRLVNQLRVRGLLDNTIIVFYSDHGESLGSHDYYYAHGENLYQPTVHIPAFIRYPERLQPGHYDGLVSSVDFFETILDLAGVARSDSTDGVSHVAAITSGEPGPREVCYLESDYQLIHPENPRFHLSGIFGKWRGLVAAGHKLIHVPDENGGVYELYDLVEDPDETTNLYDAESDLAMWLRRNLDIWERIVDRQETKKTTMDEEASRRLRSLGYIN